MRWLATTICLGILAACGGGGDKKLVDLDAGEFDALCDDIASAMNGPRTVTCPDGEITIGDHATEKAECLDDYGVLPDSCEATVADAEDCAESYGDDPCNGLSNAGCIALIECVFGT